MDSLRVCLFCTLHDSIQGPMQTTPFSLSTLITLLFSNKFLFIQFNAQLCFLSSLLLHLLQWAVSSPTKPNEMVWFFNLTFLHRFMFTDKHCISLFLISITLFLVWEVYGVSYLFWSFVSVCFLFVAMVVDLLQNWFFSNVGLKLIVNYHVEMFDILISSCWMGAFLLFIRLIFPSDLILLSWLLKCWISTLFMVMSIMSWCNVPR